MTHDFDPQAPFIASDGIEYASVADRILGKPRESYFNEQVRRYQEDGFAPLVAPFRRLYDQYRKNPHYHANIEVGRVDCDGRRHFDSAGADFYEWCTENGVAAP